MQILNKNIIILVLRLWALIFLILATAGATLWYTGQSSAFDYVLAIDASSSMLADDFQPTRLVAAKSAAITFVENLPSQSRVGLVTFAGTAFATQFLSTDMSLLEDAIQEIEGARVSGTDIGNALVTSSNLLIESQKPRAIILLTDGQDNVGVTVDVALDYVRRNQVVVHTIGIGTEEGGSFIRSGLISQLDTETLQKIASETNGEYFLAENQQDLEEAYLSIISVQEQLIPPRPTTLFSAGGSLPLF